MNVRPFLEWRKIKYPLLGKKMLASSPAFSKQRCWLLRLCARRPFAIQQRAPQPALASRTAGTQSGPSQPTTWARQIPFAVDHRLLPRLLRRRQPKGKGKLRLPSFPAWAWALGCGGSSGARRRGHEHALQLLDTVARRGLADAEARKLLLGC
jgi:hypothetical protein